MIFSSPFYRCIETINPTAETLELAVNIDRGIGEWFKPNRGVIPMPVDNKTMKGFFKCVDDVWTNTLIPSVEGETEMDIFNRCKLFWEKFIPRFESECPDVKSIVLVTHAATKIALGMSLMGYASVREFLLPKHGGDGKTTRIGGSTCGVDKYEKSQQDWNMVQNDKTDFLSLGSEMNWHFATSQFEAGSKEDLEYRRRLQREQEEANRRHGSAAPVEKNEEKEDDGEEEEEEQGGKDNVEEKVLVQAEEEYQEFYVNVVFPPASDPINNSSSQQQSQQGQQQQQQSNDLQESIDYKNEAGVSSAINKLRISGLTEDQPLFQTKNSVLLGQWSKLVGSELVFDENGEYLATVDGHIELQHGRLVPKKVESGSLLERARNLAKSVGKDNDEPEDV